MGHYISEFVVPPTDESSAATTEYDNTTSGLTATTAQDALDELAAAIVGGGTTFHEDEFVPTAGQKVFTLSNTVVGGGFSVAIVNGGSYAEDTDYTISGTTFTWLDREFSLDVGDEVTVKYQTA